MNQLTQKYARLYQTAKKVHEEQKFWDDLDADLEKNNVSPRDFSIRGLFESFVIDEQGNSYGREIISSWLPDGGITMAHVEEAGMGAVTTAAFTRITGQIVFNEVMSAFENPAFIAGQLGRTVPTAFLDGERIAGISSVGDDAEAIGEAQAYPLTGVTQAYVDTPRPIKRGHILPLTREAILGDRTNVLLDRAASIGNTMGMNKEKRMVDQALGVNNTWKRNGSTATATYNDSTTAPHDFDNQETSNGLTDYTDLEKAMLLFDAMTDPENGEPIVIRSTVVIVSAADLFSARRIINATTIEQGAISAAIPRTVSPNPLNDPNFGGAQAPSPFQILTSPYVATRITSSSSGDNTIAPNTWYVGDPMKAFRYMQVWPMSTTQLPSNSMWEFQNDIVRAWKVSEFGVPAVVEPRFMVKNVA